MPALLLGALGCFGPNPAFRTAAIDASPRDADATAAPIDAPVAEAVEAGAAADAPPAADAAGEAAAADAVAAPIPHLIGYWPLDEGGGSKAFDRSNNGRDGDLLGALVWVPGKRGGALELPGGRLADVGVRIPADQVIDDMKEFTIAAFFKLRAFSPAGTHRSIVSRQYQTGDRELFNLTCNARTLIAYTWGDGSQETFEARGPLPDLDGNFVHAAATYDGVTLILYLNGTEHGRGKMDFIDRLRPSPGSPIFIGTNHNTAHSEPFDGAVDEVVLYDDDLPAETIRLLASGRSPLEL